MSSNKHPWGRRTISVMIVCNFWEVVLIFFSQTSEHANWDKRGDAASCGGPDHRESRCDPLSVEEENLTVPKEVKLLNATTQSKKNYCIEIDAMEEVKATDVIVGAAESAEKYAEDDFS